MQRTTENCLILETLQMGRQSTGRLACRSIRARSHEAESLVSMLMKFGNRMDGFIELNERDWCHWRFPLIEANIGRDETWEICRKAGFSILLAMYEKMGRFDCFRGEAVQPVLPAQAMAWFAETLSLGPRR